MRIPIGVLFYLKLPADLSGAWQDPKQKKNGLRLSERPSAVGYKSGWRRLNLRSTTINPGIELKSRVSQSSENNELSKNR